MKGHRFGKSLSCGFVGAVFLVTNALSFGSLIFSGELTDGLAYGINSALITSTVFVVILALTSSLPQSIGGPNDKPTPILALMCAALAQSLFKRGTSPQEVVTQVLFLIAVCTVVTGTIMAVLGYLRAGEATRYVPFPVLAGFMGASALLMVMGAFRVGVGFDLARGHLADLINADTLGQVAACIAFAFALYAVPKQLRNPLAMPLLLVAGCILFHVILGTAGVSQAMAREHNWLLPPIPTASFWTPLSALSTSRLNWNFLGQQTGGLIALVVVTAVTVLISATSLELVTESDADLNRELRAHGFGNIVTGMLGGMVGTVSNTRTQLNYRLGERGRVAGVLAGLFALPALFGGTFMIAYVPRFVLGALLLDLSVGQLYEWGVKSRLRMPAYEYTLVLLIMFIIGFFGLLEGVCVGVAAATISFAVKYSKIGVIKHKLSARDKKSNLLRSIEEHQLIMQHGDGVQILVLHGYIFFGTTHSILNNIKELVAGMPKLATRFMLVDFRAVTGLDSSAGMGFAKVEQSLRRLNTSLIYTGLSPDTERLLRGAGCLQEDNSMALAFPDLDRGMEWAETHLIKTVAGQNAAAPPIAEWLTSELGDAQLAQRLLGYLDRLELNPQSMLFHEGDAADSLYLLHTGKLSVWVGDDSGYRMRLRSISKMTVVGEMGVYLDSQRSATVIVDEPSVCYRLSREALNRMQREMPELVSAFHSFIVRTLASRLAFANAQIEALNQ